MNSPATALIWEIWRKNRSGFAALVLLFAVCLAMSLVSIYVTAQLPVYGVTSGVDQPIMMLSVPGPSASVGPTPSGPTIELRLGTNVVYQGPLTNSIFWSSLTRLQPNWIRLRMGDRDLFEGSVTSNAVLDWSITESGGVRTGQEVLAPTRLQQAERALATVDRWQNTVGGLSDLSGALPLSVVTHDLIAHGWSAQPVRLTVGTNVVYEGPFMPYAQVAWHDLGGPFFGTHQMVFTFGGRGMQGARTLFNGPVAPGTMISWSFADGGVGGSRAIYPPLTGALRQFEPAGWVPVFWIVGGWFETGLAWSSVFIGFSVLVVFVMFAGAEPHAARGFTGIPPRRFALPVRTSALVAWPILLGAVTLLVLIFAWSRFVLRPLLAPEVTVPELYLTTFLLADLVLFQAVVWSLASFPKTRIFLIMVLILALIPLVALPFSMEHAGGEWPEIWSRWQRRLEEAFTLAWLGGLVAAGWGVQQERRGGWAGWQRVSRVADALWKAGPRPVEFLSPAHAQFWIEWRRNCRTPVLIWAVLAWLAPTTAVFLSRIDYGQLPFEFNSNVVFFTTFSFLIFVAIAGLNLARDGGSKKLAVSSFTATRPLASGSLLAAKLAAGVAAWLLALALICFSVLVVAALAGVLDQVPWPVRNESGSVGAGIFFVAAISLHLFVGVLPLCLTGRIPGFPWSLLPLLLIYGGLVNVFTWVDQHHAYDLLFGLLVVAAGVKLVVAYWGFRRALLLRLISPVFVAGYVALWLLVTAMVVAMVLPITMRAGWPSDITFSLPAAIVVVPLARVALSPLALAMNRHR